MQRRPMSRRATKPATHAPEQGYIHSTKTTSKPIHGGFLDGLGAGAARRRVQPAGLAFCAFTDSCRCLSAQVTALVGPHLVPLATPLARTGARHTINQAQPN